MIALIIIVGYVIKQNWSVDDERNESERDRS